MPTIANQANAVGWGPSSYYAPSGSAYWALNNDWNYPGPGTQSIDYNTSTFPNGTTIHWNYGSKVAPSNVWGYPEVVFGSQKGGSFEPANATHPANWGEQIGTLGHFNMTWDISLTGNQSQYDVLAETFLNGHEFGIFLHSPKFLTDYITKNHADGLYHFDLGGIQGVAIPGAWGGGGFAIIPDSVLNGTPMTHGSIDLAPVIQWAISEGWLSSSYQLKGFELGIEAQQGAGSMTVNNLNYDWGPGSSPTNETAASGQHTAAASGQHTAAASGQHTAAASGQHTAAASGQHTAASGQHTAASGQHTAAASGQHTAASGQHTTAAAGRFGAQRRSWN